MTDETVALRDVLIAGVSGIPARRGEPALSRVARGLESGTAGILTGNSALSNRRAERLGGSD